MTQVNKTLNTVKASATQAAAVSLYMFIIRNSQAK
jgi:hypothetical protein